MRFTTKYLSSFLFLAVILSSCSSYFSIEKRKYRDGFYVHQNIFHKEKQKEILTQSQQISDSDLDRKVLQSNSDSIFSENISTLSAENNKDTKNILIENKSIKFRRIVFQKDTLPQKKKESPSNLNEKKKSIKDGREFSKLAIIGFLLFPLAITLFALSGLGNLLLVAFFGVLAFLASIVISIISIHKIKKHRDKYKGMGFAIAVFAFLLLAILVLLIGLLVLFILLG